jgi:hypothetical protein
LAQPRASGGAEGWEFVARPWGRDAAQTWSENNLELTGATRDASPEKTDLYCRLTRFSHGCELPFSKRYSEAASSTTKGRGAGTKGLLSAFRIHLA